jgi:hypothetical protein
MYSWEIVNYINERFQELNEKDFFKVVNPIDNPQIDNVVYLGNDIFKITTKDKYNVIFQVKK